MYGYRQLFIKGDEAGGPLMFILGPGKAKGISVEDTHPTYEKKTDSCKRLSVDFPVLRAPDNLLLTKTSGVISRKM